MLSQEQDDGTEKVIAYASRVLSKPERQYCVTRKELLAVVCFIEHFQHYLLGKKFTLRTDHGSLTWLWKFKNPEGQLARWLEKLQEYDFTIQHRQGRKHTNADAMSRIPCNQCGRDSHQELPLHDKEPVLVGEVSLRARSLADLQHLQKSDATIGPVLEAFQKGQRLPSDFLKSQSHHLRKLAQMWNQLILKNGLLWRCFEDPKTTTTHLQLIVPSSVKEEVLEEVHAGALGGHLGEDKTLCKLKERYYWPGHWTDVQQWCRTCSTCATRKTAAPKRKASLHPVKAGYPMQIVAIDLMGPLPETESGNSYVLVAGDYFTRWMEAYALPNQEASTVAQKLVDELFCRFSPPKQLHSDQGRQFESTLMKNICELLHIRKTHTTPYHPQGDGLVEHFNRTLLDMLATTCKDNPFDWDKHLCKVCMAYNSSVQPSTGYTPFFLMFGRQARLPIDLMYGTPQDSVESTSDYAATLKTSLEQAYSKCRNKFNLTQERQKELYDEHIHGKPYQVGDLVWLHSPVIKPGASKKLHHSWQGPYEVVKCISDITYRVQTTNGPRKRHVVHFNRLKPCHPNTRLQKEQPKQTHASDIAQPNPSMTSEKHHAGDELTVIDTSSTAPPTSGRTSRYPQRHRQAPEWLTPHISH